MKHHPTGDISDSKHIRWSDNTRWYEEIEKKGTNMWSFSWIEEERKPAGMVVLPSGEQVPSRAIDLLGDVVYP